MIRLSGRRRKATGQSPATGVLVVVYAAGMKWLGSYSESLRAQTFCDYQLAVASAGVDSRLIAPYLREFDRIDLFQVADTTPGAVRQQALAHMRRRYHGIVLTDLDDEYDPARFEIVVAALGRDPYVVNGLKVVCDSRAEEVDFARVGAEGITPELLVDKNVAGFTNSAVTVEVLREVGPIPPDIAAVDWWIATVASIRTGPLTVIPLPLTSYRQHGDSTVGMSRGTTPERLRLGIRTKALHYARLAKSDRLPRRWRALFHDCHQKICELDRRVAAPRLFWRYYEAVNERFRNVVPWWWEDVLTLDELGESL